MDSCYADLIKLQEGKGTSIYYVLDEGVVMNELSSVVVGIWFLPVLLFIIIPLCVSAGYGLLTLVRQLLHLRLIDSRQTHNVAS